MVAMSTLVFAALAAGAVLGALLIVAGLTGRQLFDAPGAHLQRIAASSLLPRAGIAAAAGLLALAVTGWLVGGIMAAAAALVLPRILGGKRARQRAIDRTEAIASWTEMIRDSIVAASGLEEAIVATARVAPAAIGTEVRTMVRRLDHQRLPDALVAFGEDLNHPSGDLVVAALVIASRMEASDLSGLLSRLADATRGEARMRIRVEVGRTQVRTATKVIVGVVIAAVAFLALANRSYLSVYDSLGGQLMLAIVGGIFALGGWLLTRLAEIDLPERFTARAGEPTTSVGAER
jgi:tight adherence protein B